MGKREKHRGKCTFFPLWQHFYNDEVLPRVSSISGPSSILTIRLLSTNLLPLFGCKQLRHIYQLTIEICGGRRIDKRFATFAVRLLIWRHICCLRNVRREQSQMHRRPCVVFEQPLLNEAKFDEGIDGSACLLGRHSNFLCPLCVALGDPTMTAFRYSRTYSVVTISRQPVTNDLVQNESRVTTAADSSQVGRHTRPHAEKALELPYA